jgi:hypothetical protein
VLFLSCCVYTQHLNNTYYIVNAYIPHGKSCRPLHHYQGRKNKAEKGLELETKVRCLTKGVMVRINQVNLYRALSKYSEHIGYLLLLLLLTLTLVTIRFCLDYHSRCLLVIRSCSDVPPSVLPLQILYHWGLHLPHSLAGTCGPVTLHLNRLFSVWVSLGDQCPAGRHSVLFIFLTHGPMSGHCT